MPDPSFSNLHVVPNFPSMLSSYILATSLILHFLVHGLDSAVEGILLIVPDHSGEFATHSRNDGQLPCLEVTTGLGEDCRNFSCNVGVVLATGPGNPPAVQVLTAKTGGFGSRPVRKPDQLTLGGPSLDPYPSTRGFRRIWLDPSVPITGSGCRLSHAWSHSDMLLLIVKC